MADKQMLLGVGEILFNEKLYPRMKWSWQTSYSYAQAMKAGADFPPIEVANIKGKYYLVDGKHRIEARRLNGEKHVQVILNTEIKDFDHLYLEAIKRNIVHGRQFSVQEKTNIALRLKEMKINKEDISKIIQVPLLKLDKFISQRITHTLTGKEIALKSMVKHFAGQEVGENFNLLQTGLGVETQIKLLDDLIMLAENELIDLKNKEIKKRISKLFELLAMI